jgi:hypothetical protein
MPSKKKPKWNITKEEGKGILSREINNTLIEIEDKISIIELSQILKKNISHNIKHHGKNTNLLFYIINAWGGIERFVDRFDGFSIFIKDEKKYIMIFDENKLSTEHPINNYCGWELINIPEIKVY